ncbi:hypothetical protein D3C72_1601390 [compost metagenome]
MSRQAQAGARHLFAGGLQGAFQRFGMPQQALPLDGEDKPGCPRLLEQQGAQSLLQGTNAARDGRVVDAQAPRCAGCRARAGDFQEEAQVVPLHLVDLGAFMHVHRLFSSAHAG